MLKYTHESIEGESILIGARCRNPGNDGIFIYTANQRPSGANYAAQFDAPVW